MADGAEQARKLLEQAKLLTKFQFVHVVAAVLAIFIPFYVPGESVLYGCLAICAAILIHERFQARHISRLKARADELIRSAS